MLSLQEFTLKRKQEQVQGQDARRKIESQMDRLIDEQVEYLGTMERQVEKFEVANSVMEGQSKVHSTVQEAERLSAEISQLQRTESVDIVGDIEKGKFDQAINNFTKLKSIEIDSSFKGLLEHLGSVQDWIVAAIEAALKERAVAAMIEPIQIRFQFHFATNQPTNRLDKPEWYLGHLLQTINSHIPFIENCLEMDVVEEGPSVLETFVLRIANIVKEHIVAREQRILQDSFIFMHTVSELLAFISSVKESTGVDCSRIVTSFLGPHLPEWISAEKEAGNSSYAELCDESLPWIEEDLDSVAGVVSGFIELIDDLIKTLYNIPLMHAKIEFLNQVIIPLFNSFYEKVEFELPAFHGTPQDIRIMTIQGNSILKLIETCEFSWGSSLESMSLASSPEFLDAFGYSAVEMRGTVFNKVLVAFQELTTRIEDNLYSVLWESFHSSAVSFVRAMHYGVVRDGPATTLTMHDDLRKALVRVSEVFTTLRASAMMESIEPRILSSLATFLYDRLILQNYFRQEYISQFNDDLTMIQSTFARLMPNQPINLALQRVYEAQRILSMQPQARQHLAQVIKEDDLDEITNIFNSLKLSILSLGECERIIGLVRD
ncbi:hypothetical protein PSACC_02396 [Paramicrosporidium saccamoebae]|uniref:Uncharacterized protein n=1 Tax=Paramicrosporidium saccamoebae TaxID=1246581 RepID=A0A2H9TJ44_9FUNG|nr:hypothetical protein PSACC_02396 [Paramicrosporidium saccamoebae]